MKMAIVTAHAGASSINEALESWNEFDERYRFQMERKAIYKYLAPSVDAFVVDGMDGMLPAYQRGFEATENYDILAFLHDDTIINDPNWVERVLAEFEDPAVGLVGFGGALGHGDHNLYKVPYSYQQLARSNFMSNMVDAENHGKRFTGSCDVAVLDGFALIVRRELLEKAGGWPLNTPIGYVCYDYWLCCMARRLGYRIRLVGIPCAHLGGQTFVKLGIGKDPKHWQQYVDSHRYIYDEFKDVLPFEVP